MLHNNRTFVLCILHIFITIVVIILAFIPFLIYNVINARDNIAELNSCDIATESEVNMTYFETFCKAARDYNEALAIYYKKKKPEDTKAIDYFNAKIDGMFELAATVGDTLVTITNSVGFITDCKSIMGNTRCSARIDNAKSFNWLMR